MDLFKRLLGSDSAESGLPPGSSSAVGVFKDPNGKVYVKKHPASDGAASSNSEAEASDDGTIEVSRRYGWSKHNCKCRKRSKTGIVLYPTNKKHKNIVLLLCEECYRYRSGSSKTQHAQLLRWYYNTYGESKSFVVVSGFSQGADGKLGFNSSTFNTGGIYTDDERSMNDFEKKAVKKVVKGQLDSYQP